MTRKTHQKVKPDFSCNILRWFHLLQEIFMDRTSACNIERTHDLINILTKLFHLVFCKLLQKCLIVDSRILSELLFVSCFFTLHQRDQLFQTGGRLPHFVFVFLGMVIFQKLFLVQSVCAWIFVYLVENILRPEESRHDFV